jgi:hypothetical protein
MTKGRRIDSVLIPNKIFWYIVTLKFKLKPMINLIVVLLTTVAIIGDSTNSQSTNTLTTTLDRDTVIIDSTSSTMTVSENCVIFFNCFPQINENAMEEESTDSVQSDTMSEEEAPMEMTDEEIAADDAAWYYGVASMTLDTLKIKTINCDLKNLILKGNGKETKLTKSTTEGNMIYFRKDKEPVILYTVDFEKQKAIEFFKN